MVVKAKEYLDVKLSDEIEKERFNLGVLVGTITTANTTNEQKS